MTKTKQQTAQEWLADRIPADWFTGPAEITVDHEEILVVGTLPEGGNPRQFREDTRAARIELASEAEARYQQAVSWGVRQGDDTFLFTHLNVPVMTRLRQRDRAVLDTLVASGVARSRSEAMAWCVRQVGDRDAAWLEELRDALVQVEAVRATGPS